MRKYKKDIQLNYQYTSNPGSDEVVEKVFGHIFSKLIQDQKKLRQYFSSDDYKKIYKRLSNRRSILVEYLSCH